MSGSSGVAERLEVGGLLIVVVVGHRDEQRVAQANSLKHERLQGARGSAVAVEKRMHRRNVIVQRKCLNERIMLAEHRVHRLNEAVQRLSALRSAFSTSMAR